MGIENFHKWIKNTFPKCFISTRNNIYDYIYIDVNFILHNVIYKCPDISAFEKNLKFYLNSILFNFLPRKGVIFVIDGSATYSKILLQRRRRLQISKNVNLDKLNPLHLTPGTDLMLKVTEFLESYIKSIRSMYSENITIDFHIDPTTNPDEGDIKIIRHIINRSSDVDNTHIIFGNDADLIVIALSAVSTSNIYLLLRFKSESFLLSINRLICNITELCLPKLSMSINIWHCKDLEFRKDFALISILLGNDYLPKLNYINPSLLWQCYLQTINNHAINHHLLNLFDNDRFNINLLREFFLEICMSGNKKNRDINLIEYKPDKIKNYLDGLLWCMHMYSKGRCSMYDYHFNYNKAPSVQDIVYYLYSQKYENILPTSATIAVPIDFYTCLALPFAAKDMISEKYYKIIKRKMPELYNCEMAYINNKGNDCDQSDQEHYSSNNVSRIIQLKDIKKLITVIKNIS